MKNLSLIAIALIFGWQTNYAQDKFYLTIDGEELEIELDKSYRYKVGKRK